MREHWTLDTKVGAGAEGEVWLGHGRGRTVAIKLYGAAPAEDSWRTEAERIAALTHPGIVEVLDAIVFDVAALPRPARTSGPRAGIVMEWMSEGSLASRAGALDPEEFVQIARQLLETLAHVHAHGLVHLDIKPSNILLTRDAHGRLQPRLADFGLARPTGGRLHRAGTPGFAAPERTSGGPVGPWTDLFGLGVTLATLPSWSSEAEACDDARGFCDAARDWLAAVSWPLAERRTSSSATALCSLDTIVERWGIPARFVGRTPGPTAVEAATTSIVPDSGLADRVERDSSPPRGDRPSEPVVPPATPPTRDEWARSLPLGAALASVRESAMVGRDAERAWLWSRLHDVVSADVGSVVVVRSDPGCGASRLALWLARSAYAEAGIGFARCSLADVPSTAAAVIAACRGAVPGAPPQPPTPALSADLEALADEAATHRPRYARDADRLAAVTRVVARACSGGPFVWIIDDVPGPLAWSWTRALRNSRDIPGLRIVVTASDAHVDADDELALGPLPTTSLRALVASWSAVDNHTAEEIALASGGRPARARSMVVRAARGAAGAPLMASGASSPTTDRVYDVLGTPAARALCVAASLGRRCDADTWRDACLRLGIPVASDAELAAARVAHIEGAVLWFEDGSMRNALAAHAATDRPLHRACARALASKAGGPVALAHRARHHALAGDTAAAVAALRSLASGGMSSDAVVPTLAALEACAHGVPAGLAAVVEARCHFVAQRNEQAARLTTRAREVAALGPELALACAEIDSVIALAAGDIERALALTEPPAKMPLDPFDRFRTAIMRGRVAVLAGRLDEATALLRDAVGAQHPRITDVMRLTARILLGHALLRADDLDAAEREIRAASTLSDSLRASFLRSQCYNDLGELAARRGELDAAREAWERAWELSDDRFPGAGYIRANLAWSAMRRDDTADMRRWIAGCADRVDPASRRLLRLVWCLEAAVHARLGAIAAWDEAVDGLEPLVREVASTDREVIDAFIDMRASWLGRGDDARARRANALADAAAARCDGAATA